MHKKLSSWKENFLNIAGRTTLATSTLNAIPSHAMQYTLLPAKILKQINRIQRNFIWGTTNEYKKIHYVNWNMVTKSKENGGFDIKDANTKKFLALSNLAWRIITNPTVLWCKVIILKYTRNKTSTNISFI